MINSVISTIGALCYGLAMKGYLLTGALLGAFLTVAHGVFNPLLILVMAAICSVVGLILGVCERAGWITLYRLPSLPPESKQEKPPR